MTTDSHAGELPRPDAAHTRCALCHTGSPDGTSRLPDGTTCVRCHSGVMQAERVSGERERGSEPRGHLNVDGSPRKALAPDGPDRTVALDCLSCHAPHANGQPFQLRVPRVGVPESQGVRLDTASRVCVGCHVAFADFGGPTGHYRRHPVGVVLPRSPVGEPRPENGFAIRTVDIHGTDRTDDDVVSCISCHVVHATNNPSLLRWKPDRQAEACLSCHGDRRPRRPARPTDRTLLTAIKR